MMPSVGGKRKAQRNDDKKTGRRIKKVKRSEDYDSDDSRVSDGAIKVTTSKAAANNGVPLNESRRPDKTTRRGETQASATQSKEHSSDEDNSALSDDEDAAASDLSSDTQHSAGQKRRKRDDPEVFATSLSKILNSKLSTSKRADPVLARSKVARAANQELDDARIEAKARHKLREEKKAQLDRGRVRDVLGVEGNGAEGSTAEMIELERRLKKTAQRGVVKLFNAVRAAQVKGEQAAKEARKAGVVSAKDREAKVNEMSKKGFLDLIAGGGTKGRPGSSVPV